MRVVIGKSVYEMNRKQLKGVLKVASKQIPCGIYAIQKDDFCELRKDIFDSKEELRKNVADYTGKGFKVHYNAKVKGNERTVNGKSYISTYFGDFTGCL